VYLHLYQIYRSGSGGDASVNERGDRAPKVDTTSGRPNATLPHGRVSAREDAEFFGRIAVETLEYVMREMLDASGGFYSSQDADSEGEEGKFFVWTPEGIVEVLGEEDAREFCALYDITKEGNFEGHNIPNIRGGTLGDLGGGGDGEQGTLDTARVSAWKEKLFEHREKRINPFRD
jgi:hypothetical protein